MSLSSALRAFRPTLTIMSSSATSDGWVEYPLTLIDTSFGCDMITLGWIVEGRADEEKLRLSIINIAKRWRLLAARIIKEDSNVRSPALTTNSRLYPQNERSLFSDSVYRSRQPSQKTFPLPASPLCIHPDHSQHTSNFLSASSFRLFLSSL